MVGVVKESGGSLLEFWSLIIICMPQITYPPNFGFLHKTLNVQRSSMTLKSLLELWMTLVVPDRVLGF